LRCLECWFMQVRPTQNLVWIILRNDRFQSVLPWMTVLIRQVLHQILLWKMEKVFYAKIARTWVFLIFYNNPYPNWFSEFPALGCEWFWFCLSFRTRTSWPRKERCYAVACRCLYCIVGFYWWTFW
jgi:hypothetical protein